MKLEVVTTIRTLIDLEDFSTDHSVEIDAEGAEGLPLQAVYSVALGGARSTVKTLEGKVDQSDPE